MTSDWPATLSKILLPITEGPPRRDETLPAGVHPDIARLIDLCDGGYTPDFQYHFFGLSGPVGHNVLEWNRQELWKHYYGLNENHFVFAEDVMGSQYFVTLGSPRKVVRTLVNEGGSITTIAMDLPHFIEIIFSDEFSKDVRDLFQRFIAVKKIQYNPLHHLSHKIPVSLGGGDQDLDNLEFTDSISDMRFYGQVAKQLKLLPLGTRIREIAVDELTKEVRIIPLWRP